MNPRCQTTSKSPKKFVFLMGLVPSRDVDSKTKIIRSENISKNLFDRHFVKTLVTWHFMDNTADRAATEGSKIDIDCSIGAKII